MGKFEHNRVAYIDCLRGIAIAGVVAVHCAPEAPGMPWRIHALVATGAEGVQLFFVLSALTLMLSWTARGEGAGSFYLRRVFRIVPAFWLAIIFYASIAPLGHQFWRTNEIDSESIWLTIFFIHGWWPDSINSIVPGGWSIGVEMNFYLFFPLLACVLTTGLRSFVFVLGALAFACVANTIYFSTHGSLQGTQELAAFLLYWLPNSLPAFAIGFLAFHLSDSPLIQPRLAAAYLIAAFVLFVWVAWSHLPYSSTLLTPIARGTAVAVAGLSLVLCLSSTPIPGVIRRPLQRLGELSYSVYLLHWVVVAAIREIIGPVSAGAVASMAWYLIIFLTALTVSAYLASFTYRFVERPCIRLGSTLIARGWPGRLGRVHISL